ncbi:MAG: hypothetical protein CMB20_001315 [Methanobacteriota archaeon]|nr:MAG: hypothetical protein CMB20_001315 [Euryarchaeota archaeon]
MATTIRSTQLDFDTIKGRLKDFLKQQTEFADYDFEASGLSNILDVLAYNTHFTGLNANFALNESFINTAQLRSSVASLAEGLGYVPKSYSSSKADLNLSVQISATSRPTSLTLPRNTQFTSSVNGVTYTFQTRENFIGTDDGTGLYQFLNSTDGVAIPVFEGTEKTKTFFVGDKADNQIYVIPDITMDTTTIRVRVFPTASSSIFDTYTNIKEAIRITDTSTFYQIKEVPNGFYEIIFGDGTTTGKAPVAGNKIIIDYLSTQGTVANDASSFSPTADISVDGVDYTLITTTETQSAGGAYKESIESIRQNAPIAFTSQRRLVTAEDYKAQIQTNFGAFLDDVTAFSGADNVPEKFGVTFIGLKFKSGVSATRQQSVKDEIKTNLTDNMAIMSITTEYIDPITTFLEISTTFNLDPDLTGSTSQAIQTTVQNTVNNFFTTNLKKFNKVFRRSNLLTLIDAIDPAILNSKMEIKLKQSFIPTTNIALSYSVAFPADLAEPDDIVPTLTTSQFTFNSQTCSIKNQLGTTKLQIVSIDGTIEVDNIGSYNNLSGVVSLTGFKPTAFEGDAIDVSITPANQSTIRPLRNYILDIDTTTSTSRAVLDFQNTTVSI